MPIALICLDADDTLWHNEAFFRGTFGRFAELLAAFAPADALQRRLDETEHRNLGAYGYGAKGFILSMLETAADVAGEALDPATVRAILALGRDMLAHPLEPLDGVADALPALAERAPLVLVTKGDLHHQEAKLAASGFGAWFTGVEIVSNKRPETYVRIFERYGAAPERAVMAGNSVRSDILPVLEAGAWAALIPFELVWSHEAAEAPAGHPRYRELASLADLAQWVDEIA
ncbi:MAG: putative hydrolase of the superfamily [Sphingomonadales bacterium]|jgi:putative hydrolase of the HAD superfamily|nr:putative hydrolase of the superfamily [Sphingomonadales bacterium]